MDLTKESLKKSEEFKPYVGKVGDRIVDLSSSLLGSSIRPIITTSDKGTGTEPGDILKAMRSNKTRARITNKVRDNKMVPRNLLNSKASAALSKV